MVTGTFYLSHVMFTWFCFAYQPRFIIFNLRRGGVSSYLNMCYVMKKGKNHSRVFNTSLNPLKVTSVTGTYTTSLKPYELKHLRPEGHSPFLVNNKIPFFKWSHPLQWKWFNGNSHLSSSHLSSVSIKSFSIKFNNSHHKTLHKQCWGTLNTWVSYKSPKGCSTIQRSQVIHRHKCWSTPVNI